MIIIFRIRVTIIRIVLYVTYQIDIRCGVWTISHHITWCNTLKLWVILSQHMSGIDIVNYTEFNFNNKSSFLWQNPISMVYVYFLKMDHWVLRRMKYVYIGSETTFVYKKIKASFAHKILVDAFFPFICFIITLKMNKVKVPFQCTLQF